LLRFARNDGLKVLGCLKIESERGIGTPTPTITRRPGEGRDPYAAASRYAPLREGFISAAQVSVMAIGVEQPA
jgi:hypothetical protein